MRLHRSLVVVGLLAVLGCSTAPPAGGEGTGAGAAEGTGTGAAAAEGTGAAAEGTGTAAAEGTGTPAGEGTGTGAVAAEEFAADTIADGVYSSPRYNVRFNLPQGWSKVGEGEGSAGPAGLGTSDDSVTFTGPDGIRMVVANSDSIQLADASFANVTESIGFENVRIHPDRAQQRLFNGVPGYRTEADALLRGDAVPVYLIAQALELPGKPTMVTIFIPGDKYYLHSATMLGVLDSIEALNIRPQ